MESREATQYRLQVCVRMTTMITDTTKMYFLALCVNTGVWIGKVIYDVHKHIVVLNPFTPKLKHSPKNVKMYK